MLWQMHYRMLHLCCYKMLVARQDNLRLVTDLLLCGDIWNMFSSMLNFLQIKLVAKYTHMHIDLIILAQQNEGPCHVSSLRSSPFMLSSYQAWEPFLIGGRFPDCCVPFGKECLMYILRSVLLCIPSQSSFRCSRFYVPHRKVNLGNAF